MKARLSAQKAISSSSIKSGSKLLMRNRLMPSTLSKAFTKSINLSCVVSPKSPMLTPVKTISLPPSAAASSACLISDEIVGFLENPRA